MAARALLSSRLASLVAANCGHRKYSAAAAAVERKEPVGAARMARSAGAADKSPKKGDGEFSWMRGPKTGCWMPENYIDDAVDAAELGARLLFAKKE